MSPVATPCAGYNRVTSDGTIYRCHTAATSVVIAGCIHEHIGPRELCDYHAAEIERGEMNCGTCLEVPQPHHCILTAHQRTAVRP